MTASSPFPTSASHPAPQRPANQSDKLVEQEKTALENTTQGYGSTVKSRIISAKPDSETGGPGANTDSDEDDAIRPGSTS